MANIKLYTRNKTIKGKMTETKTPYKELPTESPTTKDTIDDGNEEDV